MADQMLISQPLEHLVHLFHLFLTKDISAVDEVANIPNKDPMLLFRTLQFKCGFILDAANTGWACQLEHKTFSYVANSKPNTEVFNDIMGSILKGKCVHFDKTV